MWPKYVRKSIWDRLVRWSIILHNIPGSGSSSSRQDVWHACVPWHAWHDSFTRHVWHACTVWHDVQDEPNNFSGKCKRAQVVCISHIYSSSSTPCELVFGKYGVNRKNQTLRVCILVYLFNKSRVIQKQGNEARWTDRSSLYEIWIIILVAWLCDLMYKVVTFGCVSLYIKYRKL